MFWAGGVGGVHRGGECTMDISADLTELGRTRVAVVCSGIKSILDIGRSLEYLVKYHRLAKCLFCLEYRLWKSLNSMGITYGRRLPPQNWPTIVLDTQKFCNEIYNNLKTVKKYLQEWHFLYSLLPMPYLTPKNKIKPILEHRISGIVSVHY